MKASYYGGIPGYSFYITKTYETFADLQADFNTASCPVHYGEYALVSAEGRRLQNGHYEAPQPPDFYKRRNIDNGQLYMRANDGKPEYIGNITGPTGVTPFVNVKDYAQVQTDYKAVSPENRGYATTADGTIDTFAATATDDDIAWYTVNLDIPDPADPRKVISTVEIGLRIPYPTFEFTTKQVPAGTPLTVTKTNTGKFYHQYNIDLPQGDHGRDISNLSIVDGKLVYKTTDYQNGVPQPAVTSTSAIKDYPLTMEYNDATGLITSADGMTPTANTKVLNIKDASGTPIPIQSIKKTLFVDDYTSDLNKHFLIQWNLSSLNTEPYNNEYWQDLGAVDASPKLGYYADLSNHPDYVNKTISGVISQLTTDFPTGLPSPYEACGVVHRNISDLDSVHTLYFYDFVAKQWKSLQGFGSSGSGDTSKDFLLSKSDLILIGPGKYRAQATEAALLSNPIGSIDIRDISSINYKMNVYTNLPIATILERRMSKASDGTNILTIDFMVDEAKYGSLDIVKLSFTPTV